MPNPRRICRDIHGSCSAEAGQPPSLSPPRTTKSACCKPGLEQPPDRQPRGCRPKAGRTTLPAASASNRRDNAGRAEAKNRGRRRSARDRTAPPLRLLLRATGARSPVSVVAAASRSAASIWAATRRESGTASAARSSGSAPRQASSRSTNRRRAGLYRQAPLRDRRNPAPGAAPGSPVRAGGRVRGTPREQARPRRVDASARRARAPGRAGWPRDPGRGAETHPAASG